VFWDPPALLTERGLSNNWAVTGALTDSKRPLVAGDPHQPTTSPQRLWPVHMNSRSSGGTLDVVGFSFVGTPAVQLGHNHSTAWTATTNNADVMDLWDVRIDADRDVVVLGDGDHPLRHRAEVIRVRGEGAAPFEGEDTTISVGEVEGLGVLLPDDVLPLPKAFLADGDGVLFNWTGFRPSLELSAYVAIDRAENVDAFERAAALLDVGAANYVAADASHVSYYVHARVPDRGAPASHPMPWRIMKGTDAAALWTRGDLGPDLLPHLRDPARGFVSTANNDPWGFTADGSVENDPFYYGAFYSTGFRAFRIDQRLGELAKLGRPITHDDMVALQNDTSSPLADDVVPLLATAMATLASDPALAPYRDNEDLRALATSLMAWDRRMLRDRGEPLAFHGLLWFATRRAFSGALPDALFEAIATRSPPFLLGQLRNVLTNRFPAASSFLPAGGREGLVLAALADTASWLRTRYGTVDPSRFRWGDVNVCVFSNPFGAALTPPPVGVDGGSDTIKVNEAPFFSDKAPREHFESKDVSLYRMVIGFEPDGRAQATVSFARGTREEPGAPHFDDQEARWIAGEQSSLPFERAAVVARSSERLVLPAR